MTPGGPDRNRVFNWAHPRRLAGTYHLGQGDLQTAHLP